jgi:tetratricopeptide (TPR) repeat protein
MEDAKAAARAAANKGKADYDAGRYEEALAAFREADQQFHALTFVLMIARTQDKLGRLREARVTYRQIVDERLANYAPKVFFDAQEDAKRELEALIPRIPTLRVQVTGAPAKDVRAVIDGQPAAVGEALSQDPGQHAVTATAQGIEPATQVVTLQEATAAQVTLEMKAPPPRAGAPIVAPPQADARPANSDSAAWRYAPAILFGVAGVGLGIGAITGAMASGGVGDLEDRCPDKKCYDDAAETYDATQVLSTVSTISFIAGGVLAAGGLGVLIYRNRTRSSTQAGLMVGPGTVDLRGRF